MKQEIRSFNPNFFTNHIVYSCFQQKRTPATIKRKVKVRNMNLEDRVDNYLRMYIQKDIPITREQTDEINEYMCELKNEIHDLQIRIEDFLECDKEDYRVYKQGYIRQQQRIDKAIEYIEETTKRNDELNCTKLLAVNQVEQLLEILKGKSE